MIRGLVIATGITVDLLISTMGIVTGDIQIAILGVSSFISRMLIVFGDDIS